MNKPPRQLSFLQCLVGGGVGFGILAAIFCFLSGGSLSVWVFMTVALTAGYTGYYYIRTAPVPREPDEPSGS